MSSKDILESVKKLREVTGVGFKDCKLAIDESNGDLEKAIEFLRKKGIAKASNKMSRTAAEGLCLLHERDGEVALIEINSETDFVAKNDVFISFCKEVSAINFDNKSDLSKVNKANMKNKLPVEVNLIDLIAKMGEKITIRRSVFFDNSNGKNSYYIHGALEDKIGKIVSIVKTSKEDDVGKKIAMHVSALSPIALEEKNLSKAVVEKELEIIKAELLNSGKPNEIIEKIAKGKINKFISDNTLLNQVWIMDPKKKVSDIINDCNLKIIDFIRYKVGEGV
ncbi:translation elongation factor Ts [Pelagibacteraceae bacterium]|nr:translation elongation factor Ts [Pelagibacteraceae bacterium]|tara:strand:- start:629 stop:1468 length:840 start_codon:yes stop_codon:yes gene_type:complete